MVEEEENQIAGVGEEEEEEEQETEVRIFSLYIFFQSHFFIFCLLSGLAPQEAGECQENSKQQFWLRQKYFENFILSVTKNALQRFHNFAK